MVTKKKIWTGLFLSFLITSMISVHGNPAEPRNNLRTGATRLGDLLNNVNWNYGDNNKHRTALEIAAHNLWLADQNDNWDTEDPQKPKGPFEKAFILGCIDGALEALDTFLKNQEGRPRRLDSADNVNNTLKQWAEEIKTELEKARKELEKNFYGEPQHLKDALAKVNEEWSTKGSTKGKQAGNDAAENLCQWQKNKQDQPSATPTPPWTPPTRNGRPVPTQVGGRSVTPKPRLRKDLQKLLVDIYKKNWEELKKLPQHCRGGYARPSGADKAIKLIKAIRAIARLLTIKLKPINVSKGIYVCSDPQGGWGEFPRGTPVSTGPPGTDIETVVVDAKGPDVTVTFVMNGDIETGAGKEISLLIDTDSNSDTGSAGAMYGGLGVDASVGLYCTASSPAAWHLQVWEVVKGEWILKEELDDSLFEISGNTAEFTVPDFADVVGVDAHYFGWISLAYEAGVVDMGPDEPVTSFMSVQPEEFSLVAEGADYELNEDFAPYFAEYTLKTENLFVVYLGGPVIHEGLWKDYGVEFIKDEGGHYAALVHEEDEYVCTWGYMDYCVLVFEVAPEGITVDLGGITRYGTRAGLYWLIDHWDFVEPSEGEPLVLVLLWIDENENNTVDADETVEIKVISPQGWV